MDGGWRAWPSHAVSDALSAFDDQFASGFFLVGVGVIQCVGAMLFGSSQTIVNWYLGFGASSASRESIIKFRYGCSVDALHRFLFPFLSVRMLESCLEAQIDTITADWTQRERT